MRVLVLTNNDVGLYKFRKELLEELINNNYEVFVSLPYGKFIENVVDMGCHYIETDINRRGMNPFEDISLYNHYVKIMKDIKPDVVLTFTIKSIIYGGMASERTNTPYISNISGLGSALVKKGPLQTLLVNMYKVALRKSNRTFFQNQDNLDFMLGKHIIKDNYDLLPGSGVNLKQYHYCAYPKDDIINFVFVGRTMKEKGFDLYLDTAEYIHNKYPNTAFHICSMKEENYEERINDLVSKGVCVDHGLVEDMQKIYEQIHCIIHPTYYPEGMSNVLLEASACGRPIITTNRPGSKEIIDDGVNGFVVKEKDLEDLIKKVEKFIKLTNKQREAMGKAAREKVERQFDRQIVVDKYMQEIRKHAKES